jgi:hypothetical protein
MNPVRQPLAGRGSAFRAEPQTTQPRRFRGFPISCHRRSSAAIEAISGSDFDVIRNLYVKQKNQQVLSFSYNK